MSTLTVTTTYDTAQILTEAQLDAIKNPIETYFNITQIEGNNIQANILDAATYLGDDSITTAKIPNDAITVTKFTDSTPSADTGIITSKINTDAITTAKIADSAVTATKITDLNVTTAKIGGFVPKAIMLEIPTASTNLVDLTVLRSTSSVTTFIAAGSENLIGSLTFSGLTSGKPVLISLQSTSTSAGYGYIEQLMSVSFIKSGVSLRASTQRVECSLILKKDNTTVYNACIAVGDIYGQKFYSRFPLSMFSYIDIASSTSHVYSLYIQHNDVSLVSYDVGNQPITSDGSWTFGSAVAADNSLLINSAKLVAIQLV